MNQDSAPARKAWRILIADDHTMFRQGIRQVLETQPDLEVVGEAKDGAEAIEKAVSLQPDVVLVDINMPVVEGVQAIRKIGEVCPGAKCIVVTMYRQDRLIFEAIKAGAYGYILKDADVGDLLRAIRAVRRGEALIDPSIAVKLLEELRYPGRLSEQEEALSQQDVEILRLVARGLNNADIAQKLLLSEKTIRNRLSVIFQKLHLSNRTEAALYAVREGLAPLGGEDLMQPVDKVRQDLGG